VGVIQNLAAFIAVLSPAKREEYLTVLTEIRMETDNWRFRELLASQLAAFGRAYPRSYTLKILLPLAQDLCTDVVAAVRLSAIGQIGKLLSHLTASLAEAEVEGEGTAESMAEAYQAGMAKVGEYVDTIVSLTSALSCHKRANCVQICASLIEGLPPAMSVEKILPRLEPLTADRVANVRLALATCVRQRLMDDESFAQLPQTLAMVGALRRDSDRDVLRMVHDAGYEPPRYRCKPPPPPRSEVVAASSEGEADNLAKETVDDHDDPLGGLPVEGGSSVDLAFEGASAAADAMAGLQVGGAPVPKAAAEGDDDQPRIGPIEYGRARAVTPAGGGMAADESSYL